MASEHPLLLGQAHQPSSPQPASDHRRDPEVAELAPKGDRRMGANPHANGGLLLKALVMLDFSDYAVDVPKPGTVVAEATRVMGNFLRDVMRMNADNFRVTGPDETVSNRLGALLEVTNKMFMEPLLPTDDHLSRDGRILATS